MDRVTSRRSSTQLKKTSPTTKKKPKNRKSSPETAQASISKMKRMLKQFSKIRKRTSKSKKKSTNSLTSSSYGSDEGKNQETKQTGLKQGEMKKSLSSGDFKASQQAESIQPVATSQFHLSGINSSTQPSIKDNIGNSSFEKQEDIKFFVKKKNKKKSPSSRKHSTSSRNLPDSNIGSLKIWIDDEIPSIPKHHNKRRSKGQTNEAQTNKTKKSKTKRVNRNSRPSSTITPGPFQTLPYPEIPFASEAPSQNQSNQPIQYLERYRTQNQGDYLIKSNSSSRIQMNPTPTQNSIVVTPSIHTPSNFENMYVQRPGIAKTTKHSLINMSKGTEPVPISKSRRGSTIAQAERKSEQPSNAGINMYQSLEPKKKPKKLREKVEINRKGTQKRMLSNLDEIKRLRDIEHALARKIQKAFRAHVVRKRKTGEPEEIKASPQISEEKNKENEQSKDKIKEKEQSKDEIKEKEQSKDEIGEKGEDKVKDNERIKIKDNVDRKTNEIKIKKVTAMPRLPIQAIRNKINAVEKKESKEQIIIIENTKKLEELLRAKMQLKEKRELRRKTSLQIAKAQASNPLQQQSQSHTIQIANTPLSIEATIDKDKGTNHVDHVDNIDNDIVKDKDKDKDEVKDKDKNKDENKKEEEADNKPIQINENVYPEEVKNEISESQKVTDESPKQPEQPIEVKKDNIEQSQSSNLRQPEAGRRLTRRSGSMLVQSEVNTERRLLTNRSRKSKAQRTDREGKQETDQEIPEEIVNNGLLKSNRTERGIKSFLNASENHPERISINRESSSKAVGEVKPTEERKSEPEIPEIKQEEETVPKQEELRLKLTLHKLEGYSEAKSHDTEKIKTEENRNEKANNNDNENAIENEQNENENENENANESENLGKEENNDEDKDIDNGLRPPELGDVQNDKKKLKRANKNFNKQATFNPEDAGETVAQPQEQLQPENQPENNQRILLFDRMQIPTEENFFTKGEPGSTPSLNVLESKEKGKDTPSPAENSHDSRYIGTYSESNSKNMQATESLDYDGAPLTVKLFRKGEYVHWSLQLMDEVSDDLIIQSEMLAFIPSRKDIVAFRNIAFDRIAHVDADQLKMSKWAHVAILMSDCLAIFESLSKSAPDYIMRHNSFEKSSEGSKGAEGEDNLVGLIDEFVENAHIKASSNSAIDVDSIVKLLLDIPSMFSSSDEHFEMLEVISQSAAQAVKRYIENNKGKNISQGAIINLFSKEMVDECFRVITHLFTLIKQINGKKLKMSRLQYSELTMTQRADLIKTLVTYQDPIIGNLMSLATQRISLNKQGTINMDRLVLKRGDTSKSPYMGRVTKQVTETQANPGRQADVSKDITGEDLELSNSDVEKGKQECESPNPDVSIEETKDIKKLLEPMQRFDTKINEEQKEDAKEEVIQPNERVMIIKDMERVKQIREKLGKNVQITLPFYRGDILEQGTINLFKENILVSLAVVEGPVIEWVRDVNDLEAALSKPSSEIAGTLFYINEVLDESISRSVLDMSPKFGNDKRTEELFAKIKHKFIPGLEPKDIYTSVTNDPIINNCCIKLYFIFPKKQKQNQTLFLSLSELVGLMKKCDRNFELIEFFKFGGFSKKGRIAFYNALRKRAYMLFNKIYIKTSNQEKILDKEQPSISQDIASVRLSETENTFVPQMNKEKLKPKSIWCPEEEAKGQVVTKKTHTKWEEYDLDDVIQKKVLSYNMTEGRKQDLWIVGEIAKVFANKYYISFQLSYYGNEKPYVVLSMSIPYRAFAGQRIFIINKNQLNHVLGILEKRSTHQWNKFIDIVMPQNLVEEVSILGKRFALKPVNNNMLQPIKRVSGAMSAAALKRYLLVEQEPKFSHSVYRQYHSIQ